MINVRTPFNVIQYTYEIEAQALSIFKLKQLQATVFEKAGDYTSAVKDKDQKIAT